MNSPPQSWCVGSRIAPDAGLDPERHEPAHRMRFSFFISALRSVGPVVIGISLGFSLSLLSVTWTEESCNPDGEGEDVIVGQDGPLKGARKPSSISMGGERESAEDFEPRIVPYQQVQQSTPKKVFR